METRSTGTIITSTRQALFGGPFVRAANYRILRQVRGAELNSRIHNFRSKGFTIQIPR